MLALIPTHVKTMDCHVKKAHVYHCTSMLLLIMLLFDHHTVFAGSTRYFFDTTR